MAIIGRSSPTSSAGPIPIILYNSHHDFQQTNITPSFIPEGVAGLTETNPRAGLDAV